MNHHPVAELFPPLSEDERASLRASIAANGVLDAAIVDDEGRTVDGRHRRELAAELGLPCPTKPLPEGMTAWECARTINLDRRNLTAQ